MAVSSTYLCLMHFKQKHVKIKASLKQRYNECTTKANDTLLDSSDTNIKLTMI